MPNNNDAESKLIARSEELGLKTKEWMHKCNCDPNKRPNLKCLRNTTMDIFSVLKVAKDVADQCFTMDSMPEHVQETAREFVIMAENLCMHVYTMYAEVIERLEQESKLN